MKKTMLALAFTLASASAGACAPDMEAYMACVYWCFFDTPACPALDAATAAQNEAQLAAITAQQAAQAEADKAAAEARLKAAMQQK